MDQPSLQELMRLLLWRWSQLSRRTRAIVTVLLGVPAILILAAVPAYADGSNSPSALDWINVKDSHGVSIWQYEMSIDRGGVRHPVRAVWAIFIDLLWQMYRAYIAVACWLIDWTLSMDWVGWVASPAMSLGDALQGAVDRVGATTALLTLTTVAAVFWMARGRWALGIFEVCMSMTISAVAVGILANPVSLVAGEGGALATSRDLGMQVAVGLQTGDTTNASSDVLRKQVTGMIAETFLRKPHQLVNFGQIIDGTKCEKTYNQTIKKGPYGSDDDLRDALSDCDEDLGEVAKNPNADMMLSTAVMYPAGFITVGFAAVLCGVLLVAGIFALYQGLKMIIALVLALLPGSSRGSLWMTFAELIVAMVTVLYSVVFLAAYMLVLQEIFNQGKSPIQTFFVIDVLLLVGIVVFWKGRSRLKEAANRLAAAMSKRPGAGPSELPRKQPFNAADAYYKARLGLQSAAVAGNVVGGSARAVGSVGKAAANVGQRAYGAVSDTLSRSRRPETSPAPAQPAAALQQRLTRPPRGGQLIRSAAFVGAAAATGGTSAAVMKGARQAAIAAQRRAALGQKLRPALPPGPSSRPSPPPSPHQPGKPPSAPSVSSPNPPSSAPILPRPAPRRPAVVTSTHDGMSPPSTSPAGATPATQLHARLAERRRPIALGPAKPRPEVDQHDLPQ